ncbi:hypothetical protein, partial [Olsenella uli]|uniref:hypothetical protein n=1 Tax=Olsenella uli TaxID=133926 RepID=UPI001C9DE27B
VAHVAPRRCRILEKPVSAASSEENMNAKSDSGECHSTGLDDPHAVRGLNPAHRSPVEHKEARAWMSC